MSIVESIASAIAQMEGFNTSGTIAQRNNNPGNLRSWGSTPTADGYASFPTPDAGWQALYSQIETNIGRGLSLQEFFAGKPGVYGGYSPSSDGNAPTSYAAFVGARVGIDPNTPLNGLSASGTGDAEAGAVDSAFLDAGSVDWTLMLGWGLAGLAVWAIFFRD